MHALLQAPLLQAMLLAPALTLAPSPAPSPAPCPAPQGAPAATQRVELPGVAFAEQPGWTVEKPAELFEIERVVDGDTIYVKRNGEVQKLRLLSVDTEEKFSTNTGDASKPSTVFGEECAQWAMAFFKPTDERPDAGRVGLRFPRGVEARDAYGRLLCYVILPDGRNFNLLLVQLGKSPYFNKYGNSEVCHDAFVAAQRAAQHARRGIWDPATNKPSTPGAPTVERPYARLMPWWDARAEAIERYRRARANHPGHVAFSESPEELAAAAKTSAEKGEVEVFGLIDRLFDEKDGSLTVLMRSGAKSDALRIRVAKGDREKFGALDLEHRNEEGRQNYLWVRGELTRGERGFEMRSSDPGKWRSGGPEPRADPHDGAHDDTHEGAHRHK